MAYSGKFQPRNWKKYKGNARNIIFRSLWERRFMVYCDSNPSVIEWSSEEFFIPYISPVDGKMHRYFPDFWVKFVDKDGKTRREVIEVKPKRQLSPPKKPKRQTKRYLEEVKTYAVNQAKFKAAQNFCDDRKYKFRILTEDELVPGGKK